MQEQRMPLITHPFLGLAVGDPTKAPLARETLPSPEEVRLAAHSLILSASGWRKTFADPSANGPYVSWDPGHSLENSLSRGLCPADTVIVAGMALVFSSFIKETCIEETGGDRRPVVLLGIDTRPTGPAIADVFARVLTGEGCEVRYLFIVPAPEIMAYSAQTTGLPPEHEFHSDGFAYISASHNPPGHNGLKFGLGGGVLTGEQVAPLIAKIRAFIADSAAPELALAAIGKADPRELAACYGKVVHWKRHSQSAYMLFAHRVFTDETGLDAQEKMLSEIAAACAERPFGVIAELNGSARTQSIDPDWLSALGVQAKVLNAEPGAFAHRIVPENESLQDCSDALNEVHAENASFALGYVPDCDGDRGNLVYYSKTLQRAVPLEAQQVFALVCLSELAYLRWRGEARPIAVVVNDATSMRIEAIAGAFGARVFRAETGEANVVSCAEKLRAEGWAVRILGEGSNGGNITYPSKVRDPLSTLGSMIRLLRLGQAEKGKTCFNLWLNAIGAPERYRPEYGLDDVIDSLPPWATTSAFEPYAALKIASDDKIALKDAYRRLFLEAWPQMLPELAARFGIASWKAFATIGPGEHEIGSDFGASGNGGLRIVLCDGQGESRAFLWMRASGTEPVFRIGVDIRGGTGADEAWLRGWHTDLVNKADLLVSHSQNVVG
jgi:phosphoglucomutase